MPSRLLKKFKRGSTSTVSEHSDILQAENAVTSEADPPERPYLYEPLSQPDADIRLIRGKRDGPRLSFDMFDVKHSAAPAYVALSFSPQSETPSVNPRAILLNSKTFHITENIYQALCHDCLPKDTCVWVEAICINENDLHEKSCQVQQLCNIFGKAAQTISWLGIENADQVGNLFQIAHSFPQTITQYRTHQEWCIANAASIEENVRDSSVAFNLLLNCDYWSRPWVLQELAFSRDVVVYCGSFSLTLAGVEAISECAIFIPSVKAEDVKRLNGVLAVRRDVSRTSESIEPSALLELSRTCFSVIDPTDRIYSILGLLPKSLTMPVDYNRPTPEVLIDFMTKRLMLEGPDILGEAQGNFAANKDLPSWVADLEPDDLRSYTKQFLLPYATSDTAQRSYRSSSNTDPTGDSQPFSMNTNSQLCNNRTTYRATGDTKPSIRPATIHGQILIAGQRIATINAVANACSSATFGSNRIQAWLTKQYRLHRHIAADKWHDVLSGKSEDNSTTSFYNKPGEPHYPATEQQKEKLAWEQLMNPYTTAPQYWAFLDGSMGTNRRTMCTSAKHDSCADASEETDMEAFKAQVDFFDAARRAFKTHVSYQYGIGPGDIRLGDVVVLLHGASVPHVLRPVVVEGEDSRGWQYIGEAYVQDMMYGTAMDETVSTEWFTLI